MRKECECWICKNVNDGGRRVAAVIKCDRPAKHVIGNKLFCVKHAKEKQAFDTKHPVTPQ